MGTIFFEKYPEYKIVEKPSMEIIKKYKGVLPDSFIDFWKEYGFGSFMKGYLKVINPGDYQDIFNYGYDNIDGETVFAVTGLGDFIVWTGDCMRFVNFRHGADIIIQVNNSFDWFLNRNIIDSYCINKEAKGTNYFLAREQYVEPSFDECFGYVPLLGMGGPEKVENMEKVKIIEHIYLIAEMMGKIEG